MAAHTPGPWVFDKRERDGSPSYFLITDGTNRSLNGVAVSCVHKDMGERVANAYLIAAAPQLRAFAQKIGAKHDEDIAMLPWSEAVTLLLDLAREARQLVAKADGAT